MRSVYGIQQANMTLMRFEFSDARLGLNFYRMVRAPGSCFKVTVHIDAYTRYLTENVDRIDRDRFKSTNSIYNSCKLLIRLKSTSVI